MSRARILLVEDEPGLVMTIRDRLVASGFTVDSAQDGTAALASVEAAEPELVVLDIMLPDIDGFEVCKTLRARKKAMPILMLTAKGGVDDRVKGLKIGADDYLPKPFSMSELVARIEALLRRAGVKPKGEAAGGAVIEAEPTLRFGDFTLDTASRELRKDGAAETIVLSATEFRLLSYLASHPGRVLSREELLDAAWGYNNEVASRTVDVHVAWLRQKLGEGEEPRYIKTVRRGGYMFMP